MSITDHKPIIVDEVLSNLSEIYSVVLPQDYLGFLYEKNGGRPDDDWVFDFIETGIDRVTSSCIKQYYYIDKESSTSYRNAVLIYKELVDSEQVPPSLFPIADDPGGNYILLCVSDDDYGHVYFADHELEDSETRYMVMSPLADSFTEFIDKLYIKDYPLL